MDFFRFLGSKRFLRHLAGIVVLLALVTWGIFILLNLYTRHGDYISVPAFSGLTIEQVSSDAQYKNFEFIVMDSVYDPEKPKGTIVNQDPYPLSQVKEHRKIYLTIVSLIPEKTTVPELRNMTLRQATGTIESLGLRVGAITYVPAFDDAIQEQKYKGSVIEAGTKLDKGSTIDLVVGLGSGSAGKNLNNTEEPDSTQADF